MTWAYKLYTELSLDVSLELPETDADALALADEEDAPMESTQ